MRNSERFTLLIVPRDGSRSRQFDMSVTGVRRAAWIGGFLSLLLAANLLVFGYLFVVDGAEIFNYRDIKSENSQLTENIAVERARLNSQVAQLQDRLDDADATLADLEVISGFRDFSPEQINGGMGGPGEAGAGLDEIPADAVNTDVKLEETRDSLREKLMRLEKIKLFIQANREKISHTPTGWPVKGWMSSTFGWRSDPWNKRQRFHEGVDISAWLGTPIIATADGTIKLAARYGGFGKVVIIEHEYGYETYYGHCSKLIAKQGQRVRRGDVIGFVGSTGRSTGAHVHYEVRINERPVNPLPYLGLIP